MATYQQARSAKIHALDLLGGLVDLAGVGIRGKDGNYSLSAHLASPVEGDLPREIDGVALSYEFVGRIEPSSN